MTTPTARALKKLSPRVRGAPIHNYLARERRLGSYAQKVFERGIRTVSDFILATESSRLADIRTTPENRKRIEHVLRLFGIEEPHKPPCSTAKRSGPNGAKPA